MSRRTSLAKHVRGIAAAAGLNRGLGNIVEKLAGWWGSLPHAGLPYYPSNSTGQIRENSEQNGVQGQTFCGRAYELDGTTQAVSLPQTNVGKIYTHFARVNITAFTDSLIFGHSTSDYWRILDATTMTYRVNNGAAQTWTITALNVDQWYDIMLTRSGTTLELFIDEVSQGTKVLGNDDDYTLSFLASDNTLLFNGKMRDFRAFATVKTPEDIVADDQTDMIGWWFCEDTDIITAFDASGNGFHGTKVAFDVAAHVTGNWQSLYNKYGYAINVESGELVINGDFAADTNWTKGAGWTIAGGKLIGTAVTTYCNQNILTVGSIYRIIFTISDFVSGTVRISAGSTGLGTTRDANGAYTEVLTCGSNGNVLIDGVAAFTGKIDNVSAKEIYETEIPPDMSTIQQGVPSHDIFGNRLVFAGQALYSIEAVNASCFLGNGSAYLLTDLFVQLGDQDLELSVLANVTGNSGHFSLGGDYRGDFKGHNFLLSAGKVRWYKGAGGSANSIIGLIDLSTYGWIRIRYSQVDNRRTIYVTELDGTTIETVTDGAAVNGVLSDKNYAIATVYSSTGVTGTQELNEANVCDYRLTVAGTDYYYPLCEGINTIAYDVSGNGYHGSGVAMDSANWGFQDEFHYLKDHGVTLIANLMDPGKGQFTPESSIVDAGKGTFEPETIGSNLVVNGGFDDGTGWVPNAGWTIGGGVASFDGVGNIIPISNSGVISLVAGTSYTLTFDITEVEALKDANLAFTNGSGFALGDTGVTNTRVQYSTPQTVTVGFKCINGGFIRIYGYNIENGGAFKIDNVSILEDNVESWTPNGANILSNVDNGEGGGALSIEYVDNVIGGITYFSEVNDISADLIVGKSYKVRVRAKVNVGSSVTLNVTTSILNSLGTITSTVWAWYEVVFVATTTTGNNLNVRDMGASEIIYIDQWEIIPQNLETWNIYTNIGSNVDNGEGGGALQIEYVDNAAGGYTYFRGASDLITNLVIGYTYTVYWRAKGNVNGLIMRVYDGAAYLADVPMTDAFAWYEVTFIAQHASSALLICRSMAATNIITIDQWYIEQLDAIVPSLESDTYMNAIGGVTEHPQPGYRFIPQTFLRMPPCIAELIEADSIARYNSFVEAGKGIYPLGDNLLDEGKGVFTPSTTTVIQNGDFSTSDHWGPAANWEISGGKLNGAAAVLDMIQSGVLTVGKSYTAVWSITDYTSGSVRIKGGGTGAVGLTRSAVGTYTDKFVAAATWVSFDGVSAFTGSIDNVVITEDNVESWILYGANILSNVDNGAGGGALQITYVDSANGAYLNLASAGDLSSDLVIGHTYKIRIRLKINLGSGLFKIDILGTDIDTVFSNTTYEWIEVFFVADAVATDRIRIAGLGVGEIVEIDEWTIQRAEINGWVAAGNNTLDNVDSSVECTYVDDSTGMTLALNEAGVLDADLVIGQTYRIVTEMKVSAGASIIPQIFDGVTFQPGAPFTSEEYIIIDGFFTAQSTTACYVTFSGLAVGEVINVKQLHVGAPVPQVAGNLVTNSGAVGTTDWADNTTPGIGDGWTLSGNGVASIVTGNGFIGNAQKVTHVTGLLTTLIYATGVNTVAGETYKVFGKYRTDAAVWRIYLRGSSDPFIVGMPINIGDALYFEYEVTTASAAEIKLSFYAASASANTYIEVDEVYVALVIESWWYDPITGLPIIRRTDDIVPVWFHTQVMNKTSSDPCDGWKDLMLLGPDSNITGAEWAVLLVYTCNFN